MSSNNPSIILVFSGKRKSGKDYITDLLRHRIGKEQCSILRLSAPLKKQYAQDHGLDYEELLAATDYKEKYRADMIVWGEEQREKDPGYFCRLTTADCGSPVWIISDARRQTDIEWFVSNHGNKVLTVRVEANEETRTQRGWMFTAGVDDAESECGLDKGVTFNCTIINNGHDETLEANLKQLENLVDERLKTDK